MTSINKRGQPDQLHDDQAQKRDKSYYDSKVLNCQTLLLLKKRLREETERKKKKEKKEKKEKKKGEKSK